MPGNVIDFMKLWTQSDIESERKLKKFLLMGLDKVVQGQSDVLSRIPVGPSVGVLSCGGWKNGDTRLRLWRSLPTQH